MSHHCLIDKLIDFCSADSFNKALETFVEDNARSFSGPKEEEHKLEHMTIYQQYVALFENKLEEFAKTEGISVEEVYEKLKQGRSENSAHRGFIQLLLAKADFEDFSFLMREAAGNL
eukprot:TRINITY_DN4995_c0_g2_i1.p1 TRINITY_DN4995_c0_g2~~TRINITY_DN4995_c0_g2_i1.p1  ORF type:complete len:117 (+),score=32.46 TRINITY_DN4995_c0_g2_i1:67-417(+)